MNNAATATATKNLYRTILQNIVCDRYAGRDSALRAIDEAFQSDALTTREQRDLESRVLSAEVDSAWLLVKVTSPLTNEVRKFLFDYAQAVCRIDDSAGARVEDLDTGTTEMRALAAQGWTVH